MSSLMSDVSDASFETDVLQSDIPVLVEFWSEGSAPCKLVYPTLEDIAADFQGKLKVVEFNINTNRHIPKTYGIRSVPALAFIKQKQVQSTMIGVRSRSKIYRWIEDQLSH